MLLVNSSAKHNGFASIPLTDHSQSNLPPGQLQQEPLICLPQCASVPSRVFPQDPRTPACGQPSASHSWHTGKSALLLLLGF